MSEFIKYAHVERLGTIETDGILDGQCYFYPKLDGANASIWYDHDQKEWKAGSRNRELTVENDNHGFCAWVKENSQHWVPLWEGLRLYGEWLVPHSLRTYRQDAWRKFYAFDLMDRSKLLHPSLWESRIHDFLPNVEAIPCQIIIDNPTEADALTQASKNTYLIEDGKGLGEGIVIKNYDFVNRYGRQTWAKFVLNEFKEKNKKEFGPNKVTKSRAVEAQMAQDIVSAALVEKEYHKIVSEHDGWSGKMVPRLLDTVYYCAVTEGLWDALKKQKDPTIDFKTLRTYVYAETKRALPHLF